MSIFGLLPNQREGIADQLCAIGYGDKGFHGMVAGGIVGGCLVHIMNGDRPPGSITGIATGAVPGQGVMEVHMSLLNGTHNLVDGMAIKFRRNRAIARDIV